jgi:hypothetical protein
MLSRLVSTFLDKLVNCNGVEILLGLVAPDKIQFLFINER